MASTIWNGNNIKTLIPGLQLGNSAAIYSGAVDPSSSATTGNAGDVYLSTSTNGLYVKQDSGSSTNWSKISGTVTGVSVVSANGFTGTVATSTTTPAITLATSVNSPVLAGNGTAISAAAVTGTGSNVVLNASPTFTGTAQFANTSMTGTTTTVGGGPSINWSLGQAKDTAGAISVDWQNRVLDNTSGSNVAIFTGSTLQLLDNSAKASVDWQNRGLLDSSGTTTQLSWSTSGVELNQLSANQALFTNGSKVIVSNAITGTGNVVMSSSPSLTTPNIGSATGTASGNTTYTANNHGVVLSGSANAMTVLAPDASTSKVLLSGGSSADPTWTAFIKPSAGDISETSFSASNNQSASANVTGLSFANATVRSFEALVSVFINATSSLYEVFTLRGIQKGASWDMSVTSNGDSSLVGFTITTAGQVQYTSGNYTGFSTGTIKFRANTTSV